MKKKSLKTRIYDYLQNVGTWIKGTHIEEKALSIGYKPSNASRRCRELEDEGLLERQERHGMVWYRIPEENRKKRQVVEQLPNNTVRVTYV